MLQDTQLRTYSIQLRHDITKLAGEPSDDLGHRQLVDVRRHRSLRVQLVDLHIGLWSQVMISDIASW
jgi:hypothetical protein